MSLYTGNTVSFHTSVIGVEQRRSENKKKEEKSGTEDVYPAFQRQCIQVQATARGT